jgi:hypothetical protein
MKVFWAVLAIGLDIFIQFVLACGKYKWKYRQYVTSILYFFIYTVYVVVYGGLSAVGVFLAELDVQEHQANRGAIVETANQDLIASNQKQLKTLTAELNKEINKKGKSGGYGTKAKALKEDLAKLSSDQQKLLENFKEVPKESKKVSRETFKTLSKVLGWSENFLKLLIFGTSVSMLYIGLIITSWDIEDKENQTEVYYLPPTKKKEEEEVSEDEEAEITEDKQELAQFVDGLFEDGYSRLNGVSRVAEKTGLTPDKCVEYRDLLADQGLLTVRQGVTKANYPKEQILSIINSS